MQVVISMSGSCVFTYAVWSTGLAPIGLIWKQGLPQSSRSDLDPCFPTRILLTVNYASKKLYIYYWRRRIHFSEGSRAFMAQKIIRSMLTWSLFTEKDIIFLHIFFISKNREYSRNISLRNKNWVTFEMWQPQDPSVRTESLFSNLRQFHSKFCDVSCEVFTPRSSPNISFFCSFSVAYSF